MSDFPGLSKAEYERLALLIEECGEVIQAAAKVLRHGYHSHHPNISDGPNNRGNLEKELGDLSAAVCLMNKARDINLHEDVAACADLKWKNVQKYLHHQDPKLFQGGRF